MKRTLPLFGGALFLAALAGGLGGCGTVDDSGPGYVDAYGDYGYVGPWYYNHFDVGGGYARPPFHADEHHEAVGHGGPAPNRGGPAPAGHGGGIPSIPNAPRGGGGGHVGGGGGGHSGGGGDHRH